MGPGTHHGHVSEKFLKFDGVHGVGVLFISWGLVKPRSGGHSQWTLIGKDSVQFVTLSSCRLELQAEVPQSKVADF